MRLVYDQSDALCRWAGLKLANDENAFQPAVAIGVEHEGKIIASIVYNKYTTDNKNQPLLIEMSIASVDKRWCTRHNLNALFYYPFAQLRLKRVQALCSAKDEGVQMFLKRLGFIYEGTHRSAYVDGGDAMTFGMLKSECRWVKHG